MLPIKSKLMEVGKIKIGGLSSETRQSKAGNEWRLPEKYNHFLITTNEKEDDKFIVDEVMNVLGKEPKEIEIMFLYNDIESNWQSFRAYYSGTDKCVCRSDDEQTASRIKTEKKDGKKYGLKDRYEVPCPCEYTQPDNKGIILCKRHGRLSVVLPQSKSIGGVYVFRTTSMFSIGNIQGQLEFFEKLTNGLIAGLRFTLRIFPRSTTYLDHKTNTRKRTKIYEVGIFYKGDHTELFDAVEKHTKALLRGETKVGLLARQKEDIEAGKFLADPGITAEFNPQIIETEDIIENGMPEDIKEWFDKACLTENIIEQICKAKTNDWEKIREYQAKNSGLLSGFIAEDENGN